MASMVDPDPSGCDLPNREEEGAPREKWHGAERHHCALSTVPSPGGRAIAARQRAGSSATAATLGVFAEPLTPARRRLLPGQLNLPGLASPLPAEVYVWPAPNTYTGQELVEIHTLSCPPLVELLLAQLFQGEPGRPSRVSSRCGPSWPASST